MASTSLPLFTEQRRIRLTKRQKIYDFFLANHGVRVSTMALHKLFGTAFRSRVSDINRDPKSSITILNRTWSENGQEHSEYWSERKA